MRGLGIEAVLDRVWCFCVIFKFIFGVFWIIIMEKDGCFLQHRRLKHKEAELLAVDVLLRFEDMALRDLDGLALVVCSGQCDEALGLLGLLALLSVVRRLEVDPHARGVSEEHVVQHVPEQLRELDLDAEDRQTRTTSNNRWQYRKRNLSARCKS